MMKRDRSLAYPKCVSIRRLLLLGCVAAPCLSARDATAADPQPYKAHFNKTGDAKLDAALSGSSSLIALQKTKPVSPFALAGRIRADYPRLNTALESFGYYAGTVRITALGHSGTDPALANLLAERLKGKPVPIALSVDTGPRFTLGQITIKDDEPVQLDASERSALDLHSGQPAMAADVLAAQTRLLTSLQEHGHALADVKPPVAYLHPNAHTLDIVYTVHEGPRVDTGPIHLAGLKQVNASFVRRRLLIHSGQLYQPSKIEAARQDLVSTGVFSDVQVRIPHALDAAGTIPLDFSFAEAPRHTVSGQIGYSTDLGGSAGVSWTHHNLFGNAEQLELTALATGVGGTSVNGLGYDVFANFTKPDFYRRDQSLILRVEGLKQNLQAYDQTALLARAAISRKLSEHWSAVVGVGAEQEQIIQEGVTRDYTLVSLPLSAAYDSTDLANPLDPATHGIRASIGATPSYSLTQGGAFFTILQAGGSTYFDLAKLGLTNPGRSVIAVRGIVGSVQGATVFQLPPDQRLFGGGSSTIRGYKYQGVGPRFADNNPIGGTSLDAATIEFRQRVFHSFGLAAFVDAGQVSDNSAPFQGTLRVGVGAGVRYYTPIGPIRLDIAVPLEKPPGGDNFELYIGLGETF